jgi:hypothetical protein
MQNALYDITDPAHNAATTACLPPADSLASSSLRGLILLLLGAGDVSISLHARATQKLLADTRDLLLQNKSVLIIVTHLLAC